MDTSKTQRTIITINNRLLRQMLLWFIRNYHTNAACRPEYAIRGMINNIFASENELLSDLHRDFRDDDSLASISVPKFLYSLVLLLLVLRRKHISIAPNVITERNTTNNKVVPLMLPVCMIKTNNS